METQRRSMEGRGPEGEDAPVRGTEPIARHVRFHRHFERLRHRHRGTQGVDHLEREFERSRRARSAADRPLRRKREPGRQRTRRERPGVRRCPADPGQGGRIGGVEFGGRQLGRRDARWLRGNPREIAGPAAEAVTHHNGARPCLHVDPDPEAVRNVRCGPAYPVPVDRHACAAGCDVHADVGPHPGDGVLRHDDPTGPEQQHGRALIARIAEATAVDHAAADCATSPGVDTDSRRIARRFVRAGGWAWCGRADRVCWPTHPWSSSPKRRGRPSDSR